MAAESCLARPWSCRDLSGNLIQGPLVSPPFDWLQDKMPKHSLRVTSCPPSSVTLGHGCIGHTMGSSAVPPGPRLQLVAGRCWIPSVCCSASALPSQRPPIAPQGCPAPAPCMPPRCFPWCAVQIPQLGLFPSLRSLVLSNNKLSGTIPEQLCDIKGLLCLSVLRPAP